MVQEKRNSIVRQATTKDGEYAEIAMKQDIAERARTLNEKQRWMFQQTRIEKNKFAVERYFEHLARRVRKRSDLQDSVDTSALQNLIAHANVEAKPYWDELINTPILGMQPRRHDELRKYIRRKHSSVDSFYG